MRSRKTRTILSAFQIQFLIIPNTLCRIIFSSSQNPEFLRDICIYLCEKIGSNGIMSSQAFHKVFHFRITCHHKTKSLADCRGQSRLTIHPPEACEKVWPESSPASSSGTHLVNCLDLTQPSMLSSKSQQTLASKQITAASQ